MLPGIINTRSAGPDAFYQVLSAEVGDLLGAANGMTVTPVPQLASYLGSFNDPTVSATDHGSASTALDCADRAAPRDPGFYGPLRRNITPFAFWPVAPIEPPTTIDNHHRPRTVPQGRQRLRRHHRPELPARRPLPSHDLTAKSAEAHHAEHKPQGLT